MPAFNDKVAIVTGGASGIGRALCEELCRQGASVTVADIDGDGAERVADEMRACGGRARAAQVDVAVFDHVRDLVEATRKHQGRLDYMFNNAGVGLWGDVRRTTMEDWRRVIDVNLWGAVHGSVAAYAVMAEQGFGHIVNTASLAGLVPVPTVTAYATAKHGVVGLSLSLRAEAADLGVRVTTVCPGPVRTNFYDTVQLAGLDRSGRRLPASAVDAGVAARTILRGVERNKRLIVLPSRARWTMLLARLCPPALTYLTRKSVRRLRGSTRP